MEENYQGYNQPEYENDDPRKGANKSILGYRIVIIILAVILAAITVLYYNIHRQQAGRLRPVGHRPRFDPEQPERPDAGF